MSTQQPQSKTRPSSASKEKAASLSAAKGTNISKETAASQLVDEIVFKVVFVGPTGAGKTTLVQTVLNDKVSSDPQQTMPTVGVDFFSKIINIKKPKKLNLRLQMWDCGGKPNYTPSDDEFKTILTNANAVVLCYDVQNHHSLEDVRKNWLPLVELRTKPWASDVPSSQFDPLCCFLVGTHGDKLRSETNDDDAAATAAELELDDIDDILLDELNEGGFPSKGKLVTNDDLEAVVKQFKVLSPSQVVKCGATNSEEVKQLTQDICTNLIKAYSRRRSFEKEQKEKKKEEDKKDQLKETKREANKENAQPTSHPPIMNPPRPSATPPAQPADSPEFSPREADDEDNTAPPPAGDTTRPPSLAASKIRDNARKEGETKKPNAFGGRDPRVSKRVNPTEDLDRESRPAQELPAEEPPTISPGKKERRKAADSSGCCGGDCLIS